MINSVSSKETSLTFKYKTGIQTMLALLTLMRSLSDRNLMSISSAFSFNALLWNLKIVTIKAMWPFLQK
jgi:hypothetical protein